MWKMAEILAIFLQRFSAVLQLIEFFTTGSLLDIRSKTQGEILRSFYNLTYKHTTLSAKYWQLKDENLNPEITWMISHKAE